MPRPRTELLGLACIAPQISIFQQAEGPGTYNCVKIRIKKYHFEMLMVVDQWM